MTFLTNTKVLGEVHQFFRRHWQKALRVREKVRFSEEAYHLILAGGVGVIGGLVNIFFYYANESVKELFLRHPGDPMEVAEMLEWWQRLATPRWEDCARGWCSIGDYGWRVRSARATCWKW